LQFEGLSQEFQLFALDFPGHGQSDWVKHYTFELYEEVLDEFIQLIAVEAVTLVALSLGCIVALSYVTKHPQSVSRLILEGPVGGGAPVYHPLFWLDALIFRLFPWILLWGFALFGYHKTMHFIDTYGVKSENNLNTLEALQHNADQKAARQLLVESITPPYLGQLDTIKTPILVIRGQNDPMPQRFCTYIERQTCSPYFYFLISEVRHIVALEKPASFNQIVRQFALQSNPQDFCDPALYKRLGVYMAQKRF
jgi:pimeloyl-ACP methyl ester carboxylesterase